MKIYEEAAEKLARVIDPAKLASLRPSAATSRRVEMLVQKHKDGQIGKAEKEELDQYVMMNHVMSIVKARARLASVAA